MKIESIDYKAEDCAAQFVSALRETGFAVLRNHPLSESLLTSLYQDWQEFFGNEEKKDYLFTRDIQDGFFPTESAETARGHAVKDIKEYFHYYPWGQCPPELKDETDSYYESTVAFASELLGWVEKYSPAAVSRLYPEPLSGVMHGSQHSLLRILHYPPLTGTEDKNAIRAAAHEDINLLTILPAANAPGLQVLTDKNKWIHVPCEFNTLIINTGDMLKELSQGYFPSTTHRVLNPIAAGSEKSRISLPLFLHPRNEVVLSDRYTAGSYMQKRLKELRTN